MNPNKYYTGTRVPTTPAQTERYRALNELSETVGGTQEPLATATTVFPFVLFPDTIIVDRVKVTINRQTFFKVAEVISIRIEDILNIASHVGPFFGSITITSRYFDTKQPLVINYLKRSDTLRIKRIIQGYLIALYNKIDCSALSTAELSIMLDELGKNAPQEIT